MRRAVVALALVGGATAAWLGVAAAGRTDASEPPTFTVTRASFLRRVTAAGNLRAVTATPIAVPQIDGVGGPMTLAWLARDGTVVHAGDVIARFGRVAAENQLRDAQVDLDSADARLRADQLRASASAADHAAAATVAARQAEQLRAFQASDPLLFSRNEIIESALDAELATARQAQAERARGVDRQVSRSNIELAAIARQRAQLAVDHARTALANLELRAPKDGVLVLARNDKGDVPKLGAQLWPGQAIGELPDLAAMEAELFVLEVDGPGLAVGQPTEVVLESHPDERYRGEIRLIDRLAKQRDLSVPVHYLGVVVALDRTDRSVMKPGQRVRATLVLDQPDSFAVPRQAVFERGGAAVVYRRDLHGFTPVVVQLGAATAGRIAVTSGLADGDVIAQRDPLRSPPPATTSGAPPAPQGATP